MGLIQKLKDKLLQKQVKNMEDMEIPYMGKGGK